jgi:glycosyltransferase involved in cell wall biosynthesis
MGVSNSRIDRSRECSMVRIAYFHNECAPYRMPIFEGIAGLPDVSLKVYFGRYRSPNRKWKVRLNTNFDHEILREVNFLPRLFSFNPDDDPNPLNLELPFKLLRNQYDVFIGGVPHYFGTVITFLVSKIRKKPFILFLEDTDIKGVETSSYLGRFRKYPAWKAFSLPFILARFFFLQLVLKHSSCYVVPGTATKEYLLRRGILASKIFTAWNAVDNDAIERECEESLKKSNVKKLRARLDLENRRMILSVAYLEERKGLQYLIQACAKLKKEDDDFALVIVGDGPYKQDLKRLSVQNDIETIFAGYVSNLVDYYLAADVFVLPTLHDVWGFVINEAMVCGCPIITTYDAGASRDLVKNKANGYVIETRNVEQLYQTIKNILCDHGLRQEMKKASRKMIRDFSYQKSLDGYRAAIEHVLSEKKRTRRAG